MVRLSWGRYKRTGLQKIVEGTLTGLLFIVPFIANGTICTALLQRQRLKSVSNLLLLSLLSANLLLSLCNVPFAIISIVFDRWVFGDILCEVTGFMTNALTASSNLSIIAIALHRYYLIVRPLSVKINQPRAKLLIAYVWFSARRLYLAGISTSIHQEKGIVLLIGEKGGPAWCTQCFLLLRYI